MANYRDNKNCGFYGTEYCELLNMQSCDECAFGKLSKEELEGAKSDLDVLMAHIPEEGVASLFLSDTCLLCKGETKNKRTCYGMTDIVHPEPRRTKRNFIGIKTKCRVGSLIPVQIACCSRCRRNYFLVEYVPMCLSILLALIALVVLSFRSVSEPLAAVNEILPIALFAGAIVLGYLIGLLVRIALTNSKAKHTELHIWNLPLMKELHELGWQPLSEEKHVSRLVFTKKRVPKGVYTGEKSKGKASYREISE